MERLYAETRHGKISYMFRPGKEYLVLLHGLGGIGNNFMKLAKCLGDDIGLVFPDLLGHGKSCAPENITVTAQVEAIHDLISNLHLGKFYLGGNSYGGWISMFYQVKFGDSEGLVLISSAGTNPTVADQGGESVETFLKRVMDMNSSNREESIRNILGNNSGDSYKLKTEDLMKISVPTLIIWGEKDSMISQDHGKFIHEYISGSKLSIIQGGGHTTHSTHPDQVCSLITDFINGKAVG